MERSGDLDVPQRICVRCAAEFVCGMEAGHDVCWCADLPQVMPVPSAAAGCYCPSCLRELVGVASSNTS